MVFYKPFSKLSCVCLSLQELIKWKFDLVSGKYFSYFGRKTLSKSCEKFRNIMLFTDYIKFGQSFDCYIFCFEFFFSISSLIIWFNLIFISTLVFIFMIFICFSLIIFLIEILYLLDLILIFYYFLFFWNYNFFNFIIFQLFYLLYLISIILIAIYFILDNLWN
jgi:hypothetical protein